MPVSALVTTPGAANANAYVSLVVADQYHLDRPAVGTTWATWATATESQKNAAILWATTLMDSLWDWNGEAVSEDQALSWPRIGLLTRTGYALDSDSIPVELQRATSEYARQLLVADRAGDNEIETQGITSIKAGPVALTFKDSVTSKVVPDAVYHLIPSDWGTPRGRPASTRQLVRA